MLENPKVQEKYRQRLPNDIKQASLKNSVYSEDLEKFSKLLLSILLFPLKIGIPELSSLFTQASKNLFGTNFDIIGKNHVLNSFIAEILYLKIARNFNENFEDNRIMNYLFDLYSRMDFENPEFLTNLSRKKLDPESGSADSSTKMKNLIYSIFSEPKNFKFYRDSNFMISGVMERIKNDELIEMNINFKLLGNENQEYKISQLGLMHNYCRYDRITTIGSSDQADICITDNHVNPFHAAIFYANQNFYIMNCENSIVMFQLPPLAFIPIFRGNHIYERVSQSTIFFNENIEIKHKNNIYQILYVENFTKYSISLDEFKIEFYINIHQNVISGFYFDNYELEFMVPYSNFHNNSASIEKFSASYLLFPSNVTKIENNIGEKYIYKLLEFQNIILQIGDSLAQITSE